MKLKMHYSVGLAVALLTFNAALNSMQPAEASLPAATKTDVERVRYQPISLAHSCLLQLRAEELERLPMALLHEDIQPLLPIVREHYDSLYLTHDMFVGSLKLFQEGKLSTTELEVLVHLYSGRKSNLSTLDCLNNDVIYLMKLLVMHNGSFETVFNILFETVRRQQIPPDEFILHVQTLFKFGLKSNYHLTSSEVRFDPMGGRTTTHTHTPFIRAIVYLSKKLIVPEKAQMLCKLLKLFLVYGADPNNCWITKDHVNATYTEKKPLLFEYICGKAGNLNSYGIPPIDYELIALLLEYGCDLTTRYQGKTIMEELEEMIMKLSKAPQEAPAPNVVAELGTVGERLERAQAFLNFLREYQEKQRQGTL